MAPPLSSKKVSLPSKEFAVHISKTESDLFETGSGTVVTKAQFLSTFTQEEHKSIMRKVDKRFLPLLGMMLVIKALDVNNAALAKVLQVGQPRNILKELNMTPNEYNWVQTIYFISYIIFEIPSNLILKKMTPRHWQSRIVFGWGLVLACHAAVQNASGIYTVRFLLGVGEAGLFPGLMAQLCSWYRSDEIQKPIVWMFGCLGTAGIWGAFVAYGVSYMNGMCGLSAWRWLYLLEGIFTMLFAILIFIWLPDYPKSPRSTKWLTPREQDYLEARLSENAPLTSDPAFSKQELIAVIKDPRTYSFGFQLFLSNFATFGLSWQLPTVTTSLGFVGLPRNQLLNIPPSVAGVLLVILSGWFIKQAFITRPLFAVIIVTCTLACFVVLACPVSHSATYVACVLGTAFYSAYFIPLWSWRTSTIKGATGAGFVMAFQNAVGQVGGAVAPQLFQSKYAHNGYRVSFSVCAGALGLAVLANCWTWWLTRDVECDVRRVRRLRRQAEREGKVLAGDDVRDLKVLETPEISVDP